MTPEVELRPVGEADRSFLQEVYASTREEELRVTSWSVEEIRRFCVMQSEAQEQHYQLHYPGALYSVVEVDGTPAGRLYVDHWPREIRIMDITLLPGFRGRGTGTFILTGLMQEAERKGKALSIHVEVVNPARHLYERLGFRTIEDKGLYLLMEWRHDWS